MDIAIKTVKEIDGKKEAPAHVIGELGISADFEFVPHNYAITEKYPQVNWKVILSRKERTMAIEYHQGCGHIKLPDKIFGIHPKSLLRWGAIIQVCNIGKAKSTMGAVVYTQPPPSVIDVLYSLILESDVLDYPTYEGWALETGYSPDSRNGESVYNLCRQQTWALLQLVGYEGIKRLRGAYIDY
jgi:hypothetical protein